MRPLPPGGGRNLSYFRPAARSTPPPPCYERGGESLPRTDVGSRIFALLASVVDTCRQRGHSPWRYLEQAIADRRAGRSLAALPR